MPDFIAEPAKEHDRAEPVVIQAEAARVHAEATIVVLGTARETEAAGTIRPVQTSRGPEFMSMDGDVVKRQELRLTRDGILMARWNTEDIWVGHLEAGLE
jgi:hypothetical protein